MRSPCARYRCDARCLPLPLARLLTDQPTDAGKPDEKAKLLEERLELQRKENELLKKENELLKRETELLKKEGKKIRQAITGTTPRVGVVNTWIVVQNYKRTEELRGEMQAIVKKYEDELAAIKKELEGRKFKHLQYSTL